MHYTDEQIQTYATSLARVAALSNLFSESKTPYLHYRTTEYLYSRIFDAKNLARSDIAIDASLGTIGVGIKTFVYNGKPKFEKIAEFNKENELYNSLPDLEKVQKVAELRNKRIDFAGKVAGVNKYIYHCIVRLPGLLCVFEDKMPYIDIDAIQITDRSKTTISFTDGIAKYRFNTSKSTLFKEFFGQNYLFEQPVTILEDPFSLISSIGTEAATTRDARDTQHVPAPETVALRDHIVLPLYGRQGGEKHVFERSGLNQWNANGRARNPNEVYIPIPVEVRTRHSDFLPDRDTPFELHFPNGDTISMKVSQAGGKALMSQRNADLGEWLLRDVLSIEEGQLITYELLESIGIDSVEISKENGKYYIDFKELGTYEEFIENEN